jgi:hypothetical protein
VRAVPAPAAAAAAPAAAADEWTTVGRKPRAEPKPRAERPVEPPRTKCAVRLRVLRHEVPVELDVAERQLLDPRGVAKIARATGARVSLHATHVLVEANMEQLPRAIELVKELVKEVQDEAAARAAAHAAARAARVCRVPADVDTGAFKGVERLLGPRGQHLKAITRATGARVCLRGQGVDAGATEPLHFLVEATPEQMPCAIEQVQELRLRVQEQQAAHYALPIYKPPARQPAKAKKESCREECSSRREAAKPVQKQKELTESDFMDDNLFPVLTR